MELRSPEMRGFGNGEWDEIPVSAGGKDTIEPGLFVLMARSSEGCSRKFFGVETEGGFLRGIAKDGQGTFVMSIFDLQMKVELPSTASVSK